MPKANDRQEGGDHYQQKDALQHWDVCWNWHYNQFEYCITKYVERYKRKNGLEDLKKARHHLDKYIEVGEYREKVPRVSYAMIARCEDLGCNDLQAAVLLHVHTGDLVSASHYLNKLIEEQYTEGGATKEYVDQ